MRTKGRSYLKYLISIFAGLLLLSLFISNIYAYEYDLTVGNDNNQRYSTDLSSDFVVVDTNHPVAHSGILTSFSYYATNLNPFCFLIVGDLNTVKWVSDEIIPSDVGINNYYPPSPVSVESGWNVGLYFPTTETIYYEHTGNDALYTLSGHGIPTVDETLTNNTEGNQSRTYSFIGVGFLLPLTKDQCKKDGWITFGYRNFKNQGICIKYINERSHI